MQGPSGLLMTTYHYQLHKSCLLIQARGACIGTGSSGATIRMYVEQYVPPEAGAEKLNADAAATLQPLVNVALTLSNMAKLTGRDKPTVIT